MEFHFKLLYLVFIRFQIPPILCGIAACDPEHERHEVAVERRFGQPIHQQDAQRNKNQPLLTDVHIQMPNRVEKQRSIEQQPDHAALQQDLQNEIVRLVVKAVYAERVDIADARAAPDADQPIAPDVALDGLPDRHAGGQRAVLAEQLGEAQPEFRFQQRLRKQDQNRIDREDHRDIDPLGRLEFHGQQQQDRRDRRDHDARSARADEHREQAKSQSDGARPAELAVSLDRLKQDEKRAGDQENTECVLAADEKQLVFIPAAQEQPRQIDQHERRDQHGQRLQELRIKVRLQQQEEEDRHQHHDQGAEAEAAVHRRIHENKSLKQCEQHAVKIDPDLLGHIDHQRAGHEHRKKLPSLVDRCAHRASDALDAQKREDQHDPDEHKELSVSFTDSIQLFSLLSALFSAVFP